MHKKLLPLALLLPVAASAQKLVATTPPVEYETGTERVYLYRSPSDTVNTKTGSFVSPGEEATIVGQYSPRWLVVKRMGFLYLASARGFPDYGADLLPLDPETKQYTYEGVKEVAGISKADLYSRAFEWAAHTYNSAQNVVQMQDKDSGKIIIKALQSVANKGYSVGTVSYTLSIYLKDGRYKYVLTDFTHKGPILNREIFDGGALENMQPKITLVGSSKIWGSIRRSVAVQSRALVISLESAMAAASGKKDPSDF